MNKKGFTLIEMLVVIAIIAILVAIIVPTVASSTNKAKGAADAANFRSLAAEAAIDLMTGSGTTASGTIVKPFASKCYPADTQITFSEVNGAISGTTNNSHVLETFVSIASTGEIPTT